MALPELLIGPPERKMKQLSRKKREEQRPELYLYFLSLSLLAIE